MNVFLLIVLAYLLGAIPCGYIAGKIKEIDVTKEVFKKIGTSNIYKTLGFLPAVFVFFSDFMKSIIPILIGRAFGFSVSLERRHLMIGYLSIFSVVVSL